MCALSTAASIRHGCALWSFLAQIVRMKGGERQEDAMFKGMQQWAVSVARMGDAIRKLS